MSPLWRLRWYLFAIILGLWIGSFNWKVLVLGFIFIGLILGMKFFKSKKIVFWIVFCFGIGFFYVQGYKAYLMPEKINEAIVGKPFLIEGKVLNYPKIKAQKVQQYLKIKKLGDRSMKAKILIEYDRGSERFYPGDEILISSAQIQEIRNFKDFDYQAYLWQFGVSGKLNLQIDKTRLIHRPAFSPWAWSRFIRNWTEMRVKTLLPEPHSLLSLGMTIGLNQELDPQTQAQIKNAGLQHLIVVSGSNVALLIAFVALIFRRMGPLFLLSLSVLSVGFFWLVVGPEPPVNRAVVFGIIGAMSLVVGRAHDGVNLLLLAALVLGLFNPLILRESLSFWLSFLATLGIVCWVPLFYLGLARFFSEGISAILALIFAAQIAVLPIIIIIFGAFPMGGFLANLLVEPIVPLIMCGTVILALTSWIPGVGFIVGMFQFWVVSIILFIAQFGSQISLLAIPETLAKTIFLVEILIFCWMILSPFYQQKVITPFQQKLWN